MKYTIRLIIILVLFFSGCGYQFAGSGSLPEGIETVYVKIFENRTSETGLENQITNYIIEEFTRKNRGALSDNDKTADAVLSGVVKSISESEIIDTSEERRLVIKVDFYLTASDGSVVRFVKDISQNDDFLKGDNEEQDKKRAIGVIAEELAEAVYYRLTDDF